MFDEQGCHVQNGHEQLFFFESRHVAVPSPSQLRGSGFVYEGAGLSIRVGGWRARKEKMIRNEIRWHTNRERKKEREQRQTEKQKKELNIK